MRSLSCLLLLSACTASAAKIAIQDAPTHVLSRAGETHALRVKVWDARGLPMDAPEPVQWQSADPAVLGVDHEGLLTARSSGVATIAARIGALRDELRCRVSIVGEVVIDPADDLSLKLGQSALLRATVFDDHGEPMADERVRWTSSTHAVETSDGRVTAQALGVAQVRASAGEKSAVLLVTVR